MTPCFVLDQPGGVWHYPTRQAAQAAAARFTRDGGPPPVPRQLAAPCATLVCDEGGEGLDENGDGNVLHFASQAEADKAAAGYGWTIAGGRRLCPDCVAYLAAI